MLYTAVWQQNRHMNHMLKHVNVLLICINSAKDLHLNDTSIKYDSAVEALKFEIRKCWISIIRIFIQKSAKVSF